MDFISQDRKKLFVCSHLYRISMNRDSKIKTLSYVIWELQSYAHAARKSNFLTRFFSQSSLQHFVIEHPQLSYKIL